MPMLALDFTVEEMNAIALYRNKSRRQTINRMKVACEYILEDGLYIIFMSAIKKLNMLSDEEYESIDFILTN